MEKTLVKEHQIAKDILLFMEMSSDEDKEIAKYLSRLIALEPNKSLETVLYEYRQDLYKLLESSRRFKLDSVAFYQKKQIITNKWAEYIYDAKEQLEDWEENAKALGIQD